MMEVKTEISARRIADVLVSAFEGGSNYWYTNIVFAKLNINLSRYDEFFVERIESGSGQLFSLEDKEDDEKKYKIDVNQLKVGVQKMAEKSPDHFSNIITEDDDAITGDVLLQYIVFGEILYG